MIKKGEKPEQLYWVALASSTNPNIPPLYLCIHYPETNAFHTSWANKKRFVTKLADCSNIGINAEVYDTLAAKSCSVDELLDMEAKLATTKELISGFNPAWREYAGEEHQHNEFTGDAAQ